MCCLDYKLFNVNYSLQKFNVFHITSFNNSKLKNFKTIQSFFFKPKPKLDFIGNKFLYKEHSLVAHVPATQIAKFSAYSIVYVHSVPPFHCPCATLPLLPHRSACIFVDFSTWARLWRVGGDGGRWLAVDRASEVGREIERELYVWGQRQCGVHLKYGRLCHK